MPYGGSERMVASSPILRCFCCADFRKFIQHFHRGIKDGSVGSLKAKALSSAMWIPVLFSIVRYMDFSGGNLSLSKLISSLSLFSSRAFK